MAVWPFGRRPGGHHRGRWCRCRRSAGCAAAPGRLRRSRSVKSSTGTWGFSSTVVVSWPVTGSGLTLAGELDDDPGLFVFEDDVEGEEGVEGVVFLGWPGRPSPRSGGRGRGRRLRPCRSWRRRGTAAGARSKWTGRWPRAVVRPIWAGVQAPRPSAEAGLTTRPCGSVTVASRRSASPRRFGFFAFALGQVQVEVKARGRVGDVRGRPGFDRRG